MAKGPDQLSALFLERLEKKNSIDSRINTLSPKEKRAWALLGQGVAPEEIAKTMKISLNTAYTYINKILRTLNTHSQKEAAALWNTYHPSEIDLK